MMPTALELLGPDLYAACAQNDVELVKKLASSIDCRTWTTKQPNWAYILDAAAENDAVDVAAYCLVQGAQLTHFTIYSAVCVKPHKVCRLLVESGSLDVNRDIDRTGPILGLAVGHGDHDLAQFLLEKGARPNVRVEAYSVRTTLACAAMCSDETMVKLLLDHGAKLEGSEALYCAAQKGKLANVKLLITRGADVNEVGVCRRNWKNVLETPMQAATANGHSDVEKELLQAGAQRHAIDQSNKT